MRLFLLVFLFLNFHEIHLKEIVLEDKIHFNQAQISKYLHKRLKCGKIITFNEYERLSKICKCNYHVKKNIFPPFFSSQYINI